jgi:hypothetical protein
VDRRDRLGGLSGRRKTGCADHFGVGHRRPRPARILLAPALRALGSTCVTCTASAASPGTDNRTMFTELAFLL